MAQRERLGVAGGRRDPGRTPSLTSTGRVQGRCRIQKRTVEVVTLAAAARSAAARLHPGPGGV